MGAMETLWAEQALTDEGWRRDVRVAIDANGQVAAVDADSGPDPGAQRVDVLLPAPANLHSHAFQRALAGLTERCGPDPRDSFWTWRELMYRFLDRIGPEEIEAIAAFAQMQMLEAGFAAVAEFHYVHHRPGGAPYDNLAELAYRIAGAASRTGIGLTLLPVLYQRGGCDGRALQPAQLRFGNDPDRFARLHEDAAAAVRALAPDARLGVAAHSLRAVSPEGLAFAAALAPDAPLHVHAAEQVAEVEEVEACLGARPVEWLLANAEVGRRWCLIHATHMTPRETEGLARSGAVAGLCPITEANLGDGIFEASAWLAQGGTFGVGTDSNVRISLNEELRTLEYSQRLRDRARAVLARPPASTGRTLFEGAARGGAQAAMRDGGTLSRGRLADLVALDAQDPDLAGRTGDTLLDGFVFSGGDRMVTDVWSAGRHVVRDGRHVRRDEIVRRYVAAISGLKRTL